MNRYPYSCLEQKLSKAISSEKDWDQIMNQLNTYLDGDGLLKFFPMSLYGSEILTSYVLILSSESDKNSRRNPEYAFRSFESLYQRIDLQK